MCMCMYQQSGSHLLAEANGRSVRVIKLTFWLNMHMYIGGAEIQLSVVQVALSGPVECIIRRELA